MVATVGLLIQTTSGFGGEKVYGMVLREMARAGRVRPMVITVDERSSPIARQLGVRQVSLERKGTGPMALLGAVRQLRKVIAEHELSAVVSFMTYANIVCLAAVRSSRTGCRAVVSEHTQTRNAIGSERRPRLAHAAVRALYPSADAVLAVSRSVEAHLVDVLRLRAEAVSVVDNPIDVDMVLAGAPDRVARNGRTRRLVCVGALKDAKGHSIALDALARLPTDFRLDLVGEGPLRGALESQSIALGLVDRVRFHGFVANPYPLLAAADAMVHPSLREGFGLAVVEAGILGVPVVAAEVGGLPELVPELVPGVVVAPADADALAGGILRLFENYPIGDGEPIRSRIRERFDPATVSRRYEQAALGVPAGARS